MTNWFNNMRLAQKIESFEDRNSLNQRIKTLKSITIKVKECEAQIGYRDASEIQKILQEIHSDKKMSSFPTIKETLGQAIKVSRDNYNTFKEMCLKVVDALYHQIQKLEDERNEFDKLLAEKMRNYTEKK